VFSIISRPFRGGGQSLESVVMGGRYLSLPPGMKLNRKHPPNPPNKNARFCEEDTRKAMKEERNSTGLADIVKKTGSSPKDMIKKKSIKTP